MLDFYVHESCQRVGHGKFLLETMLDNEKLEPHQMGYDRPSSKFLNLLKKNYGLENYVPQVNNFVVFNSYFTNDKSFKVYFKDPIKVSQDLFLPRYSEISNARESFMGLCSPARSSRPEIAPSTRRDR